MNLFPELTVNFDPETVRELPVFTEWAYDFEHNRFLTRGGQYYKVEKKEALKIWLYKMFKAERYRYQAYPRSYGHELGELVGLGTSREILESEAERLIQEAILVNPYFTGVYDFEFEHQGSRMHVTFCVDTVYGEMEEALEFNG